MSDVSETETGFLVPVFGADVCHWHQATSTWVGVTSWCIIPLRNFFTIVDFANEYRKRSNKKRLSIPQIFDQKTKRCIL